jgi:hypothetical protein
MSHCLLLSECLLLVQLQLSVAAVCLIPGTNIGGGNKTLLSRLEFPSVLPCLKSSNLLVVIWVGLLFVPCDFFFSTVSRTCSYLFCWRLAKIARQQPLSSLLVLSSASETSSVWVSAPFDVAAWDVWIVSLGPCGRMDVCGMYIVRCGTCWACEACVGCLVYMLRVC